MRLPTAVIAISTALLTVLAMQTIAADTLAQTDHARDERARSYAFALLGDTPYGPGPGEAYAPFERLVDAVNQDRQLRWVLHAGDIKTGSSECSDALFYDRLARFNQFDKPFIYTPGDNEWTDCHRVQAGQYQPLERLARLREIFFPRPGLTLGGQAMRVQSQAHSSGYEEFPENVRWHYRGVVYATLHIVGSHNGLAAFDPNSSAVRSQDDDAEVARRNAANLTWLQATFDMAERLGAAGVFIMIQANPGLEFTACTVHDRYGFEDFLSLLEARTVAYGKPVVLAHGDSHYFRIDQPRLNELEFLPNFTRVETYGAQRVHWIRIEVDPRSKQVFQIQPKIVAGNS